MPRITVPTIKVLEITLDATKLLPTAGRIRAGMKTVCRQCHKEITDEFFVSGLKRGYPNMIFCLACVPLDDPPARKRESNMVKHTEGPWEWDKTIDAIVSLKNRAVIATICRMDAKTYHGDQSERDGNAKLLALSLDGLALAEMVLRYLSVAGDGWTRRASTEEMNEIVSKAREIKDNAKGRTP
jgi:hypothetical protein